MNRLTQALSGSRWRRGFRDAHQAMAEDRGASLVEYALVGALVAALSIGALEALGSQVDDTHADQVESIEGAELVSSSDEDATDDGAPTVSASCSGATCGFSVASPSPATTYTWSASPGGGGGTGTAFTFTGAKNGGPYTVTVTANPGGSTTRSVTCTKGGSTVCSAS